VADGIMGVVEGRGNLAVGVHQKVGLARSVHDSN
jgi:hypothetical protein